MWDGVEPQRRADQGHGPFRRADCGFTEGGGKESPQTGLQRESHSGKNWLANF